jgi:anti-anti-sigma regulatory factor
MLRITRQVEKGNGVTLRLEGRLLEPWVSALRQEFDDAAGGRSARLDLSAVSFLDAAGVEAVRELLRRGAELRGCSNFVRDLLGESGKDHGDGLHNPNNT